MSKVPLEDLPLLRFFSNVIDELGTSDMNAVQMQRRIGARTGGISPAMLFEQVVGENGAVGDPLKCTAHFALRGKATVEKASDLFDLTHSLLSDANLKDGQQKAIELLRESQTRLESSFISSGNSFAGMRLAARNSLHGYIGETTQGVSYYESVKAMLETAKEDWPTLLARLEKLRDTLISQDNLIINLTADQAALDAVRPVVDEFVAKLPGDAKGRCGCAELG